MTWLPQFLIDARGYSYVQVGQIASVGTIAGIPGCIVVAAVSDRLKKRKTPLIIFSATYVVLLSLFLYLPVNTPIIVFTVISFLINFTLSFWVLYFSMIPESLPIEKAGIALGIVNGMGTIGFSVLTPIYGRFVDLTGQYGTSNLIILIAAILMPIVFTFYIKECYGGINEN
jgi:sugar phosphate permease